jgi:hypothetical protein
MKKYLLLPQIAQIAQIAQITQKCEYEEMILLPQIAQITQKCEYEEMILLPHISQTDYSEIGAIIKLQATDYTNLTDTIAIIKC